MQRLLFGVLKLVCPRHIWIGKECKIAEAAICIACSLASMADSELTRIGTIVFESLPTTIIIYVVIILITNYDMKNEG